MIPVGIDALSFYTPRYYFDLKMLALARNVDADKFVLGLGQNAMSIAPPNEDIVTMGANAAKTILENEDPSSIAMILFATESGVDQSKAAGLYIQELLELPPHIRILELKQACYAGTGALQLALPFLRENENKKILVIASDIARYGLGTTAESSQGAGAIAMLLSSSPRLLTIEPHYGIYSTSVMDFWRPNYSDLAFVDGKYSSKLYLSMLEKTFVEYQKASGHGFHDHAAFCYHSPVPRLVEKAHQHLKKIAKANEEDLTRVRLADSLKYNRDVGNTYTASLYLSLLSLLENSDDLTGKRIGFYSYGSGCVAEFFSGLVNPQYQNNLHRNYHHYLIETRKQLSYDEYENYFNFKQDQSGNTQIIPPHETGQFCLEKIENHKRIYQKSIKPAHPIEKENSPTLQIKAPGKLILSGEHAVLYGAPALAVAIDRYVSATISREAEKNIHFQLKDFAHQSNFSLQSLQELKDRIKTKYLKFIRGDYSIRQVLQKPFELAQVALGLLSEKIASPLSGMNLTIESNLPIGCGMGSSAATILSVMKALSHFFGLHLSEESLYKAALEAENFQHGHSSGLDLRLALHGGYLYVENNQIEKRVMPPFGFHLIQTGQPQSSTGECVESAKPFFQGSELINAFSSITKEMDRAIREGAHDQLNSVIRKNHRLLCQIGVVPKKVQAFINEVEYLGGAAKICGAGSVAGDAAGTLWLLHDHPESLKPLIAKYQYDDFIVHGVENGVYAA